MRKSVAVLAAAILASLFPFLAMACSCKPPANSWESNSPVIFYAQILSTELTSQKRFGVPVVVARYRLIEKFRGIPAKELRTITDDGLCGFPLLSGAELIVHTDAEGWVFLCSGTRRAHPELDKEMFEMLRKVRDRK